MITWATKQFHDCAKKDFVKSKLHESLSNENKTCAVQSMKMNYAVDFYSQRFCDCKKWKQLAQTN